MATALSEFKKLIAPDVYPCPDPFVERELLSALIEFCRKTNIIVREFNLEIDSTDIDSDLQDSIDFDIAEFADDTIRPVQILDLMVDTTYLEPKLKNIQSTITNWETIKENNVQYFWWVNNTNLRLFDIDSDASNLYLKVSYAPVRTATTVEDEIFNEWSEAIVAGTKHKLMSMPGKEWTDAGAAQFYLSEWRKYLSQAKRYQAKEGSPYAQQIYWRSQEMWGV
jgi:hypothetical protein